MINAREINYANTVYSELIKELTGRSYSPLLVHVDGMEIKKREVMEELESMLKALKDSYRNYK